MLRPRIIPCLLIKDGGLVKTVNFSHPKYVGDPINAVKIFNEKLADELMVVDIDASIYNRSPNYKMIKNFAAESRMPVCYAGGVKTLDQVKEIIGLGVEKVGISSGAISNPNLITEASNAVGNQSVVGILDVKKRKLGGYSVFTENGKKDSGKSPTDLAITMTDSGAGEIVLNSIDNDGCMCGYDLKMIDSVRKMINVPMTAVGGAGSVEDIINLVSKFGVIGAAAGSMFVFKGKYRAVLISFPNEKEKNRIISKTKGSSL